MGKNRFWFRVVLNTTISLVSAIGAHAIACGTFVPPIPFAVISTAVFLSIAVLTLHKLSAIKLAAVIALTQASSHFFLGSMTGSMPSSMDMSMNMKMPMSTTMHMSSWIMFGSHTISGILCFIFIHNNEKFFSASRRLLTLSVNRVRIFKIPDQNKAKLFEVFEFKSFSNRVQNFLTAATGRLPAPPAYR